MIKFRKIVLLLTIPGALALPGPAEAAYFSGPDAVAVYDFNVNQMSRQWRDWVALVNNTANPVPDIILGQDFENDAERIQFRDYISSSTTGFGVGYSSIGSETADTAQQRVIFWRTNRFTLAASDRWRGFGGQDDAVCLDGAVNAEAVQVRLTDNNTAGRSVAAVSMKTPPKGTNNQCAWENMVRATNKMERAGYNGTLHVVGTDANARDFDGLVPTCWWAGTVTVAPGGGCGVGALDLGYSDPIYDSCGAVPGACIQGHWTHRGNNADSRIDFIFAKRGSVPNANSTDRRTIDKGVCMTYSDHCSVRALISYA